MSFVSADKSVDPSPTSQLDLSISPVSFVSNSGTVDQVAHPILKKSTSKHPTESPPKKVCWKVIKKEIKVLEPINPEDLDSDPIQRLEALRGDLSLSSFVPTGCNLDPTEALSLFSEELRKDPVLSAFVPGDLSSKPLSSQDLVTISDRVRRHPKTEVLLDYFFIYFTLKSRTVPTLIGEAIEKLVTNRQMRACVSDAAFAITIKEEEFNTKDLEARIEKITSEDLQEALFSKISQQCRIKGRFNEFIEVLLNLLPLKEVACIRLAIDHIATAEKLNEILPQTARFTDIQSLYKKPLHEASRSLGAWVKKIQVYLGAISELNLNGVEIQRFEPRMIRYLANVRSLTLARLHLTPVLFRDLCKFSKLEQLNLSSNGLNANSLKSLFNDIKTIKTLKRLDVSKNPIRWDEISEIVTFCRENHIQLVLSADKKVQDYLSIVAANSSDPYTLDLSRLRIETFPEDLFKTFSNLESVIFKQSPASPAQTLEIMKTLLKLSNVKVFDFSENHLSPASIHDLVDAAEQHAPNAMIIRDLSKSESNLISALGRIAERLLSEEDLNFDPEIPRRFKSYQDLWQEIHPSIEAQKEVLQGMSCLDFSGIAIETLPPELVAYFTNVEELLLESSYPKKTKSGSNFSSLLSLPKLEEIDLSYNYLTTSMFLNLANLVQTPEKMLKRIYLSECKYNDKDIEAFISLCEKNDVELIFNQVVEESSKRKREPSDEEDEEWVTFAKQAKT